MVKTHPQKYTPPFIMQQSSTPSACGLSQQIFMWPSCQKFLQNAKTEGLAKLRFCWVSRLDNKYLNLATELHSCYQNQKQIFSAKLDSSLFTFRTLSAKCKMHQKNKKMQLITKVTYQESGWAKRRGGKHADMHEFVFSWGLLLNLPLV